MQNWGCGGGSPTKPGLLLRQMRTARNWLERSFKQLCSTSVVSAVEMMHSVRNHSASNELTNT